MIISAQTPDTIWTKTFGGGSDFDFGTSVEETNDSGFIVIGRTDSFGAGSRDVWLLRMDRNGDTLWTRTFGGSSYDMGLSVKQASDGGFILAGWTHSFGGGQGDAYIIKTDEHGNEESFLSV